MLAAWGSQELVQALLSHPMQAYTGNTISTPEAFEAELERVREQGYAFDLEEFEEGLRCIAAPVRDHSEQVVAAIGIAGPRRRFDDEQLAGLVQVVASAASQLSRNLGYVERASTVRTAMGS